MRRLLRAWKVRRHKADLTRRIESRELAWFATIIDGFECVELCPYDGPPVATLVLEVEV